MFFLQQKSIFNSIYVLAVLLCVHHVYMQSLICIFDKILRFPINIIFCPKLTFSTKIVSIGVDWQICLFHPT